MSKQKIILIGGGGHSKACIEVIEQTNQYDIAGILDRPEFIGTHILGYEIIGSDKDISKYVKDGCQFLITVGQIKSSKIRAHIFHLLEEAGAGLARIISPLANVSKYAEIGRGSIVMHNVMINAGASVGENCILNTGCNIEHDVIIGNNTHVSTNAVINGNCIIGNDVFVGSNATVANGITLNDQIVIGAGTVVNRSLWDEGIYIGNPAVKIDK